MEKERMRAWAKFFSTRHPSEEVLDIKVNLKEGKGEIKVEKFNIEYSSTWLEHYVWNHQLFIDAKSALEDKNWIVFAAYNKENEQIILVKHRLLENFYFKAQLINLIENGFGYELVVYPVELIHAMTHKIFKSDARDLGSAHFKEKRKSIDAFFYNWILKNSPDRLRLLSGVISFTRNEE